jgi:hypothetical protein
MIDDSIRKRAMAVMGIDSDTDDSALKYAYYRLMLQYHPDRNPDTGLSHEITALVSEAFQVLSGKNIKPEMLKRDDLVSVVSGRPEVEIEGMMSYSEWLKQQFYNMDGKSIWSY